MATLSLPRQLLALTQLTSPQLDLHGVGTVEEAMRTLSEHHPMLKSLLYTKSGGLQQFVNVFVDGELAEDLAMALQDDSRLQIVVAVAGG